MKIIDRLTPSLPVLLLAMLLTLTLTCDKSEEEEPEEEIVVTTAPINFDLGTHTLTGFSSNNRGITVIYESGLGGDASVWGPVLAEVGKHNRGLAYNRAGYATSGTGPEPRNLERLVDELHQVKLMMVGADKVVLVGHSWGGAIVRSYTIRYPQHVHGIVFVDSSHERELRLSQSEEDDIVDSYRNLPGARGEAEQLIEGVEYLETLPNLPDIPVTAITNGDANSAWAGYHRSFGNGLSVGNFQQLFTISGHNIQINEPELVIRAINELIDRL